MAAETQYTGNTGMVTISTANINRDGTGTLGTVLTAASSGTLIKSVKIKAQATTTQGMIRLYVYDGTNTRLLTEISVPAKTVNTTTGTECSFETILKLNYKLQSGYLLKASTEKGESFNIIAEGLNWTYYTTSVRLESTAYTANSGFATISTANTGLDGSGTLGIVLTAGASGTFNGFALQSITVKALGTVTHGMVRIFIYNGTTSFLLTEVFIKPKVPTATFKSFEQKITFPETLQIAPGYVIKASTQNAESFAVIAEGMNWNYPGVPNNFTPVTIASSTTETILHSYQIPPNFLIPGNLLGVYGQMSLINLIHNHTFRIYVNTANQLSGATALAINVSYPPAADNIERMFPVISDTVLECYGDQSFVSPGTKNQYKSTTFVSGNVTVPSLKAGFWVLISCQNGSVSDTSTLVWSMVEKVF